MKRVYTIPKGAYNVAIREENSNSYYTGHFLGLKDARGTFLIRGEYVTKPGVFRTEHSVVHGNTLWKYQNVHTQDVLETKGPTTEEYTLSMKLQEARKTYNIKITYALKGRAIKPPPPPSRNNQWNYQWKHMTPKRGRCSVECGNGHKVCRNNKNTFLSLFSRPLVFAASNIELGVEDGHDVKKQEHRIAVLILEDLRHRRESRASGRTVNIRKDPGANVSMELVMHVESRPNTCRFSLGQGLLNAEICDREKFIQRLRVRVSRNLRRQR